MHARLPIDDVLPAIVAAMRERGRCVLVAPPGAGKTTRVPGALLDAGAIDGEIIVLQPRRLAARLAATRVASERGPVGKKDIWLSDSRGVSSRLTFDLADDSDRISNLFHPDPCPRMDVTRNEHRYGNTDTIIGWKGIVVTAVEVQTARPCHKPRHAKVPRLFGRENTGVPHAVLDR